MRRFYYDLHLHSCLSPCADNDNTPNNIAGMASLSGLNLLALTDHNSCKNCPSFFDACRRYEIIPIAGMELTTAEDIHVVCLFEDLSLAMEFDAELQSHRILIPNRPDIFGEQLIMDSEDNIIGKEEHLLSNATNLSLEEIPSLVKKYGGICYPAHIDRDANGIIAILGTLPPTPKFEAVEIRDYDKLDALTERYKLSDKHIICDSDSHYLTDIRDACHYFEFDLPSYDEEAVRKALFSLLRKEK